MSHFNVGQFFVLGFDGADHLGHLEAIHNHHGLGGAILFNRNVKDPFQLKALTQKLRKMAQNNEFVICIDQEGGRFQILRPPHFNAYPPANEVREEDAYSLGRKMGDELRDLGINMCNGPVLDVNTNVHNPIINVRSFAHDPKSVAKVGAAFIKGMQETGVMACGKHFPGHGDTDQDSHLTLPIVRHNAERLEKIELLPFRELMHSGLRMMMSAHVVYPAIDQNPATFSKRIMSDLLRRDMNYQGLVITDDMGMAAARAYGDLPEACLRAFQAGCDLILLCEDYERHEEIMHHFEEALINNPALRKRCEESAARIKQNAWTT